MSHIEELRIARADGRELAATLLQPVAGDNGCVVQINSALAVPRQFYRRFGEFLAARGFSVLSFDYAGLGDSRDGHWRDSDARLQDLGEQDIAAVIDYLQQRYRGYRHVAVGHSAGAALFGLAGNCERVDALYGVAAPSAWIGNYALWQKPKLWFFWYAAIPLATRLYGYFPGQYFGTGPMPAGIARQWQRWARNPHYVTTPDGAPWREPYLRFRQPLRLLHISDDQLFAPLPAVQQVASFYSAAPRQIISMRPRDIGLKRIGHFGFFRAGMPESVWQATADWLLDPCQVPVTAASAIQPVAHSALPTPP